MTGAKEDIDAAATQFGVYYEAHEGTAATGYLVDHTSTVAMVYEDGYLREDFLVRHAGRRYRRRCRLLVALVKQYQVKYPSVRV